MRRAETSSSQRRPPKLKPVDRAISVVVDDYSPRTSGSFSLSPRPSTKFNDQRLNIQRSSESVGAVASTERTINKRSARNFYRGETIDLMDLPSTSSTSLKLNQKKNEYKMSMIDCHPISRHYSIRHPKRNNLTNQTSLISKQQDSLTIPEFHSTMMPSPQKIFSPYKDVLTFTTNPNRLEANSFSSDDQIQNTSAHIYDKPRLPPKQKSISYFDDLDELNKKYTVDMHRLPVRTSEPAWPKTSSSLEKIISLNSARPLATKSEEKILRRNQTITAMNQNLIAPISRSRIDDSFEKPQYSFRAIGETIKKSQSFRYKHPRENTNANESRQLFKSRKSKSFVNSVDDMDYICSLSAEPPPSNYPINFPNTKHHRSATSPTSDRKLFIDELRGLSGDGSDLLPENSATALKIDFGALDFNTIYKSYKAQQKESGSGRDKRKNFESRSSIRNNSSAEFEYSGKKKKIAIAIFVVTFCVVLFAATAVIVTLTNSSGSPVHNQTRQIFSSTRDSRPIHFGGGFSGIN